MTGNLRKVEDVIAAWNRIDKEAILAAFHADAVYHNIPMAPAVGLQEITETVSRFLSDISHVDWKIVAIAETQDGHVLTERVDAFIMNGKHVSIPVMGIFEFRGGLISSWRDYFDLPSYLDQLK